MSGILRRLFRRSSISDDIREELDSHIAMRAERNQQAGMSPEEALHLARRQFGNSTVVREQLYEFSGFAWLDTLRGDLVYAVRGLRRNPGLSLTAILTITIAVGAAASMFGNIAEDEPRPYYFRPLAPDQSGPRALLVRITPAVGPMDRSVRQALQELDAGLPFVRIETLGEALNPQIRPWRLGAAVFTAFGILAMVLTMVGLWSSVSYAVAQRTSEFAVRLAIGAKRQSLMVLVLGDGLRNALTATAAGLAIAAVASGFIANLLFEVSPRDPVVFGGIAGTVLAVATLSSLLPAWRATRIQPIEALRAD